jgi:hypothetical protein
MRLANIAQHQVYEDNQQVVAEGDPGNGFYLVVEGQVRVTLADKENKEVARINPGGFFGEMAMLANSKRSASVWTVGSTTLLWFEREAFMPLLDVYPTMREILSGVALQRAEENLWRVLFEDEEVQQSLASLGDAESAEQAVELVPEAQSAAIAAEQPSAEVPVPDQAPQPSAPVVTQAVRRAPRLERKAPLPRDTRFWLGLAMGFGCGALTMIVMAPPSPVLEEPTLAAIAPETKEAPSAALEPLPPRRRALLRSTRRAALRRTRRPPLRRPRSLRESRDPPPRRRRRPSASSCAATGSPR